MCASQTPFPHASIFFLLATSATGPHPLPSRTRSLSPSAPPVLPLRGGGRVGRRQLGHQNPSPDCEAIFLFVSGQVVWTSDTARSTRPSPRVDQPRADPESPAPPRAPSHPQRPGARRAEPSPPWDRSVARRR